MCSLCTAESGGLELTVKPLKEFYHDQESSLCTCNRTAGRLSER